MYVNFTIFFLNCHYYHSFSKMNSNFIDISFVLKYHMEQISVNGIHSARALGWNSREGQHLRFDILAQTANLNKTSLLDIGCGVGDLLPFLNSRFSNFKYTGLDLNEHFLMIAAERYQDWENVQFLHGDMNSCSIPIADIILISGALSYRNSVEDYVYKLINKIYDSCNTAFAFNLLKRLNQPSQILCTHDPENIMKFCSTISKNVSYVEGYLEGDYTVRMYK